MKKVINFASKPLLAAAMAIGVSGAYAQVDLGGAFSGSSDSSFGGSLSQSGADGSLTSDLLAAGELSGDAGVLSLAQDASGSLAGMGELSSADGLEGGLSTATDALANITGEADTGALPDLPSATGAVDAEGLAGAASQLTGQLDGLTLPELPTLPAVTGSADANSTLDAVASLTGELGGINDLVAMTDAAATGDATGNAVAGLSGQ